MSACFDLSVAVFLDELPVAHTFEISPFESIAVFVFLDHRSVSFAVFIGTFELRAVGIMDDHLSLYFSVEEVSFEDVAVFLDEFAVSVLPVLFPVAGVGIAVAPYEGAFPVFVSL